MNSDAHRFEVLVVPHLDAAYNLARWLTRDESAAQDVVQESCLRALGAIARFDGESPRAWLLKIVRNHSYTWIKKAAGERYVGLDDEEGLGEAGLAHLSHWETPEVWMRAGPKTAAASCRRWMPSRRPFVR